MMFQADQELRDIRKRRCGSEVKALLKNMDTEKNFREAILPKIFPTGEINLGVFENGGNYELLISSENEKLEFANITFGDIWGFCRTI